MKLEVGMYARNKIGIIGKIISMQKDSANNDIITIYNGNFHIIHNENIHEFDIVKASHNIIDLIEVGDVVELFMEYDIDKEDTNIFELVAITDDKKEIGVFNSDFQIEFFPIENLRGIVTKEMFESISYKIGD